jgi:hypothetical protein
MWLASAVWVKTGCMPPARSMTVTSLSTQGTRIVRRIEGKMLQPATGGMRAACAQEGRAVELGMGLAAYGSSRQS